MAEYLHIFLRPKVGITNEQVKSKMNLAVDWYKYSEYCWLVKTTSDADKWKTRLIPLVKPDGSLLIMSVDPKKRQGWFAKGLWDWLAKNGVKKG